MGLCLLLSITLTSLPELAARRPPTSPVGKYCSSPLTTSVTGAAWWTAAGLGMVSLHLQYCWTMSLIDIPTSLHLHAAPPLPGFLLCEFYRRCVWYCKTNEVSGKRRRENTLFCRVVTSILSQQLLRKKEEFKAVLIARLHVPALNVKT